MKKVLGLLIVIVVYAAASYYTGIQGEKNIRTQFALSEQQNEVHGVKLVLNRYERGIFFSEIDVTATYADLNLPIPFGPITLSSQTKAQHGPLLFFGGFGVGLFSAKSTFNIVTGNESVDQGIKNLFGTSIGEIVTVGHFNNSYSALWTVPALRYVSDTQQFSLAESSFTVRGSYSDLNFKGSFNIGASEWLLAGDAKLSASPMTGSYEIDQLSEFLSTNNMEMKAETITFVNDAAMTNATIHQFEIIQQQKLVNEKLDTLVSIRAEKISSPVEITNLRYDITLNQLNPAVVEKWAVIARKWQAAQPEDLFADNSADMDELLELILQEGLEFKLGLGADFMDGSLRMDLNSRYKPLPAGRNIKDIVNPEDYLSLIDGNLVISVSESIVNQTPLVAMVGEYMNTYITKEGDQYILHATLVDGQLAVGTIELPAAMLLMFLAPSEEPLDAEHLHDHLHEGLGEFEPERDDEGYDDEDMGD